MKRFLLSVSCATLVAISAQAAGPFSLKETPIGLSVNQFVERFGAPDSTAENVDSYSHILRYDPATNHGLTLRGFFISGNCVAVLARLPRAARPTELLPEAITAKTSSGQRQVQPWNSRIYVMTEDFDNQWIAEVSAGMEKKWNPDAKQTEYGPYDPATVQITAIGVGDKDYFLEVVQRVPELRFITTQDFFRPGASLPTAQP